MRLHLKVINDELTRLGHAARLEKGSGYFYFHQGEAEKWLDRTVRVRTIHSLTLKKWIEEFRRLKALNEQIMQTVRPEGAAGGGSFPDPLGGIDASGSRLFRPLKRAKPKGDSLPRTTTPVPPRE